MLNFAHGVLVEHKRYIGAERNAHNALVPKYADPVPIDGVGIDLPDVNEPRDGASQREIVSYVFFLPPGTTCDRRDMFIFSGDTYEVEGGQSLPIKNPFTGSVFPTPVKVRIVDG